MIVRKVEVNPVANRRKLFLLALTAGICYAVFVGISQDFSAIRAPGNNPTDMKIFDKAITTTSNAQRLACLELAEGISSVFPTIFWRNTTALLSLALATSILFHLLIIGISSWLHLPSNGRKRFSNRSRAGSVSSATVTFPSREIGLSLDFDSVLANIMESGTTLLLLGASNRRLRFSNRFRACSASSATTTSSFRKIGFNFNINYSIRFHSKTNTATHQLSQLSGQEIVESPMLANAPAFEETQTIRPLE